MDDQHAPPYTPHLDALRPDDHIAERQDGVLVAEVMTSPVLTIEANASVAEARDRLQQSGVHHLVVVDRGRMSAVASDRDLLRALSPFLGTIGEQPRDARTLMRPVFQVATYHPITVRDTASIAEAAALMLEHEISCLPVLDSHGALVGIVTTRDLMRGLLSCVLPPVLDATAPQLREIA